jgi:hypothetical protein
VNAHRPGRKSPGGDEHSPRARGKGENDRAPDHFPGSAPTRARKRPNPTKVGFSSLHVAPTRGEDPGDSKLTHIVEP